MKNLPDFKYINNKKSETLTVLLHGSGVGMNSQFMMKLLDAFEKQGDSVITFNFPFYDRGDEHSSGPELNEEVETINNILDYCNAHEYKRIRLVGKSLGGIIASHYLKYLSKKDMKRYEIIIFGYITGSIKLREFSGNISIIQGEKDKFGNIKIVKSDLRNAVSNKIKYFEIAKADHSYRDPETKEPIYEDVALSKLF